MNATISQPTGRQEQSEVEARPRNFAGPQVLALLSGEKTTDRRIIRGLAMSPANAFPVDTKVWVREVWRPVSWDSKTNTGEVQYAADNSIRRVSGSAPGNPIKAMIEKGEWVAGVLMPRWATRCHLTVTDARAHRINEITEDEALAEGIKHPAIIELVGDWFTATDVFAAYWDYHNGEGSWFNKPLVWAHTFKVEPLP